MDEALIKNTSPSESSVKEELISVNIILEIKMGIDKTVLECKNININDMLKEIIPNFNDSLENNNKKIYLNPESNDYQLCECTETIEDGIRTYKNGNILEKMTKLQKISSRNFKIIYSPKDILLNFKKKKKVCDSCLII